jgi:hypothetical protein
MSSGRINLKTAWLVQPIHFLSSHTKLASNATVAAINSLRLVGQLIAPEGLTHPGQTSSPVQLPRVKAAAVSLLPALSSISSETS